MAGSVKQKTFEFDSKLAKEFEEFCRARMMVEKRVAAAAICKFMELTPDEREQALLALDARIAR